MTELRTRSAGPGDLPALLAIDTSAASDAGWRRILRRAVNANECYVAERGSDIIAFGILQYTFFEHGLIGSVVVSESVRFTRTVSALLRYMEGRCRTKKLFASAAASDSPLQGALRRLQYEDSGAVSHVAEDGGAHVFFYKELEATDARVPEHHFGLI